MSSQTPSPADGDQPRRRTPFLEQSYGDLLRSMALIVLLVLVIYGCSRLTETDQETPVTQVDYTSELAGAREAASYDVLAPEGLPDGWRATSVDAAHDGDVLAWHLGFLNPDDEYVGLEQTNGGLDEEIRDGFEGQQRVDTLTVGGRRWDVYDGEDNVLVNVDGDVTTVVVSRAEVDVLRAFAAALRRSGG
ncbi:MAG: DUF4245 family protein [Propionibacteriales bacterium]|nr:DUF4245 family protein [Propionibacteriales bacterium]